MFCIFYVIFSEVAALRYLPMQWEFILLTVKSFSIIAIACSSAVNSNSSEKSFIQIEISISGAMFRKTLSGTDVPLPH
jgi:hypothetical protein